MDAIFRRLEINGGKIKPGWPMCLKLPAVAEGYADAQIDDYGGSKRKDYKWRSGTTMDLRARFSHGDGVLKGTAGFGFWNAPFGDPTVPFPAIPQTAWFFYGSKPTDLPLPRDGPGRGWFVSTIGSNLVRALMVAPITPAVILLNNISLLRSALWLRLRRYLGISYRRIEVDMTDWHAYRLVWGDNDCQFWIDDQLTYQTECTPSGPLGFVCWLDNQYLVATPTGRLRWGTIPLAQEQWLEIDDLQIGRF